MFSQNKELWRKRALCADGTAVGAAWGVRVFLRRPPRELAVCYGNWGQDLIKLLKNGSQRQGTQAVSILQRGADTDRGFRSAPTAKVVEAIKTAPVTKNLLCPLTVKPVINSVTSFHIYPGGKY